MSERKDQTLQDVALFPQVQREYDPHTKNRSIFWQKIGPNEWQRIWNNQQAEIIADGDIRGTKAFVQEYQQVRRTVWQRLVKSEIADVVDGPQEVEMRAKRQQRREAILLWMREVGMDIDVELQRRLGDQQKNVVRLGPSVALLESVTLPWGEVTKAQNATSSSVGEHREKRLDILITAVEKAFLDFESHLRVLAQQVGTSSYLKTEELFAPFDAVRINQNNNQRNMIRRRRKIAEHEVSETIVLTHPNYFFYDLKEGHHPGEGKSGGAASFSPVERIMYLPPEHDPQSLLRLLIQYHEIRHANQDASRRVAMMNNPSALQAYIEFHSGRGNQKPKLILTEEASAYAYELEVLNLLLKGKLQSGQIPPVKDVIQTLGCTSREQEGIESLLELARNYYPEGMTGAIFTTRFLNVLKDWHIAAGYDVYLQTPTGGVRQLSNAPLG